MSNGVPKIKLLIYTTKRHFPVFAKNFKLKFVLLISHPWALRVSGMFC